MMSRIIRFVLMVQFLIFVTIAAQTPAEASGGPVCQDVMCAVGSHCDGYVDCPDPNGVHLVCTSCAPDDTGGSGGTGGTGGAGPAVPEPTSALLFAAGIAVAALSTKVMRRK
jgi:hypothetical protein